MTDFLSLGSKITETDDYSKRHLLLGWKAMTNLDRVLTSRDITLPTEFHVVNAMGFLVVMYSVSISPYRRLSTTELMLLNCGARKDS